MKYLKFENVMQINILAVLVAASALAGPVPAVVAESGGAALKALEGLGATKGVRPGKGTAKPGTATDSMTARRQIQQRMAEGQANKGVQTRAADVTKTGSFSNIKTDSKASNATTDELVTVARKMSAEGKLDAMVLANLELTAATSDGAVALSDGTVIGKGFFSQCGDMNAGHANVYFKGALAAVKVTGLDARALALTHSLMKELGIQDLNVAKDRICKLSPKGECNLYGEAAARVCN